MANQLCLFVFVILSFEYLKFIKILKIINENIKFYKKIFKLFSIKNASDSRKQKALLNYSKNLFLISFKIVLILLLIVLFIYIINLLNKSFLVFLFSIYGIIEAMLIFFIYSFIRKA
tara:strand:+ start:1852 stop:2202 length:351 start_codon:yes stop_codon:yes gene_type:complete